MEFHEFALSCSLLSFIILAGKPRLPPDRVKNTATYPLMSVVNLRTEAVIKNGPVRSTTVVQNGSDVMHRSGGRVAISWGLWGVQVLY